MTGVETEHAPPSARSARPAGASFPHWRTDALLLAVVTVLIRIPAFVADRALVFDDGVFAASVRAMRHGELPFRDVFSSQGPLFLPLLWVADLVGLRSVDAPRVLGVASGVVLVVAVYSCARRVTTRANALLAAGLVTTSGSVLWVTAPVNADGPSLALSVLAIAFALRYRDDPRLLNAVWVGLAVGGAMSIKALSGPAVVVAGLIVLTAPWPRRTGVRDAAIAAATALAVYLLVALPFGLGDVWDQSVTYHQDARDIATTGGAFKKVLTTLWDRDKLLVVALALAAIAYVVRLVVRRRAGRPGDRALTVVTAFFLLWTVILLALLVWEPALWRAHVAHLVPPLALLASLRPAPWKVLVVAGVVTVPFAIASNTNILWPDGYRGQQAAVVRRLETFASGARFISDEPGLVWRADRDIPGEFADASFLRIDDGRITQRSLVRGAAAHDVCGVLVTSAMHYGRFGGLADALVAEGYHPVRFGDEITLYERDSDFCRP